MKLIYALMLRAYLPALILSVLLAAALRPVGLPHGAKVAACFVLYLFVQTILGDRISGRKRSQRAWAGTVILALFAGAIMWLVGA